MMREHSQEIRAVGLCGTHQETQARPIGACTHHACNGLLSSVRTWQQNEGADECLVLWKSAPVQCLVH